MRGAWLGLKFLVMMLAVACKNAYYRLTGQKAKVIDDAG